MDTQNLMPEKENLKPETAIPETVQEDSTEENIETVQEDSTEENIEAVQEDSADEENIESVQITPEVVVEEEPTTVEPVVTSENSSDEGVDDDSESLDDEKSEEIVIAPEITKQELCDKMKLLLEQEDITHIKNEVEAIKQAFYKKNKAELDSLRAEFLDKGGSEIDFIPAPTELEAEFKDLLNTYRLRKAKFTAQQDQEKENNLLKKNHIIEQMKQLVESKEDVSANIAVFRQLQQDWKKTGPVPAVLVNDLWRQYNMVQESFWDLIKINNELREYDFKKNLEAKTKICELAEELDKEEDIVSAFRQLQKYHEEWHELGPVARELRDEIWNRFKAASTVINKKHQTHFDEIRAIEDKNLELKKEICERIKAIDTTAFTSYKDWDEATKQILDIQEEWRQIGFAPRKFNQKIFTQYREACDVFFAAKAEFFKQIKANLNLNLEKKVELCKKAEELKDSTDWKETTDKFIQLQKEWKTIGPTPKKNSNDVWKRFITACDAFFEQKNANLSGQKAEELQNLKAKQALLEKIKSFKPSDNPGESLAALRGLAAEWNSIGHVPFKEKDKLYKEYRSVLDMQFDNLNISAAQRRLESFKSNLKDMTNKGENKLYREREKLVRAYESLKAEIATYENNIGFLSISSKKGGGMLQEMEHKIDALKDECKLLEKKINMIDEQL